MSKYNVQIDFLIPMTARFSLNANNIDDLKAELKENLDSYLESVEWEEYEYKDLNDEWETLNKISDNIRITIY